MCTMNASTLREDGQALSKAVLSVAEVLRATDPELAKELSAASNALTAVTNDWQDGTPVEVFNSAADALEAVLAEIPQTAAVAPFIPIAVAALDVLIAQIPTSPAAGQPSQPVTVSGVKQLHATLAARADSHPNPHRLAPASVVTVHHALIHNPRGDFRAAWNNMADAHPDVPVARI